MRPERSFAPERYTMKVLLKNCRVPGREGYSNLLVCNGVLEQISREAIICSDEVKQFDLNGRLVFNGFVDAHMHLDKAFVNEIVCNRSGTLQEAIEIMKIYKASMTEDDVRMRSEKLLQMAWENGTRLIRTHVDVEKTMKLRSIRALLDMKKKWAQKIKLQIVAFPQDGIVDDRESYYWLEEALKAGADVVGGIPAIENDPAEHIRMIFELAEKYDVDIDMHIDENDDPECLTILELCRQTEEHQYQGRVIAGHLCSLASCEPNVVEEVLGRIKMAKIGLVSLPSTNLYLEGRDDKKMIRRGIMPIRRAHEKGIPTTIASDNVRDPFNPFGNANPLETALIAAHGCHMGGEKDLENLFEMITTIPQKMIDFSEELRSGKAVRLIALNAFSGREAIISQAEVYGYMDEDGCFQLK